jgi:hypothetical protein
MELFSLAVIVFLCLHFEKSKVFAYVLLGLLLLAFPRTFIAVLVIAFVIHFFNKPKQRKLYEPPTLPKRD